MSDDEDEKKSSKDDAPSSSREDVGVEGKQSVLVLTGSNQSGKSVYGKGVALIVYMAQIGWFVSSSLRLLDDVLLETDLDLRSTASFPARLLPSDSAIRVI